MKPHVKTHIITLVFIYHVICLTEFVPDPEVRQSISLSAISIISIDIVITCGISIVNGFKQVIKSYRIWNLKRKIKQRALKPTVVHLTKVIKKNKIVEDA